jgi:hypothetical protein
MATMCSMRDLDELFRTLERSAFRRRFKLGSKERSYVAKHGIEVIREHASRFVVERLSPASPVNDGRQTPMRNHPVFIAQHATATCCRGCLERWHGIKKGRVLTEEEITYIIEVISRWIEKEMMNGFEKRHISQ